MPSSVGDLADAAQAGVEVALDLERQGAVVERLGELAEGDLARADEDDALHGRSVCAANMAREAEVLPVEAQATRLRADHAGVGEGGGHAVVFEAAGGVEALVLQEQLAGLHADFAGQQVALLEQRAAFADGDDLSRCGTKGSSSRNRQTPEKSSRPSALRPLVPQRCSKNSSERGTASRSQS